MRSERLYPSEKSAGPAPLVYRVKVAAATLAMSRSRFYELVAAGEIRVLKDGARTLVRVTELEAYLDRLEGTAKETKRRARCRSEPNRP